MKIVSLQLHFSPILPASHLVTGHVSQDFLHLLHQSGLGCVQVITDTNVKEAFFAGSTMSFSL